MPIYNDEISMMKDALKESLLAAKLCIDYKKGNDNWSTTGCLGFPGSILLFSMADAIGSYYRGRNEFKIKVNGSLRAIKKPTEHFFILNSAYYGLTLEKEIIDQIYESYRCKLIHNSLLPQNHFLDIGNELDAPFVTDETEDKRKYPIKVNLLPFYKISEKAVNRFLNSITNTPEIESKMIKEISKKDKKPKHEPSITHASTGSTEYISTQLIKEQQDDDKK